MARPRSKDQLLQQSTDNYQKLLDFIDEMEISVQESTFPPGTMNRNIRDVLLHLYHWHLMFMEWYDKGMKGIKPDMPAKGYTWKMTPELNQWIWSHYQNTSLTQAKKMLHDSHLKIMHIINGHSEEELFTKKRYNWTGSTSLGAYLISASSSHYDWAFKLIKKSTK